MVMVMPKILQAEVPSEKEWREYLIYKTLQILQYHKEYPNAFFDVEETSLLKKELKQLYENVKAYRRKYNLYNNNFSEFLEDLDGMITSLDNSSEFLLRCKQMEGEQW